MNLEPLVLALGGVLLVLTPTACASGTGVSAVQRGELGVALDCATSIDTVDGDGMDGLPDYEVVSDVVALPTGRGHGQGRTGTDDDPESARRFSKMGLLVRPGTSFLLHVAGGSQGNASITWGGMQAPVSSVSVDDCDGPADTWLVFAGGIWVLEPDCVDVLVITDDQVATIRVPIAVPDCT